MGGDDEARDLRQRLDLLLAALSPLGAGTERHALAQAVADLVTHAVAPACQVDLYDGDLLRTAAKSASGHGGPSTGPSSALATAVAATGRWRAAVDAGGTSWVALPLVARGRTLGVVSIALPGTAVSGPVAPGNPEAPEGSQQAGPPGHPEPPERPVWLDPLEGAASALAFGLASAEAHEQAVEVSRRLQESLLPIALPSASWFSTAGRYLPAETGLEVGGDWYDAQLLDDGQVAVSVGDVAGHGVEAAVRMGEVRSAMTALRLLSRAPDELVSLLHRVSGPASYLTTAVCGRLDPLGGFKWASAGHVPPIAVRPSGGTRVLETRQSPPLGIGDPGRVALNRWTLARGDAVLLFTDGLVERRDEAIDVSLRRLAEQVATTAWTRADELAEQLVRARQEAGPVVDDVAVLVAVFHGTP